MSIDGYKTPISMPTEATKGGVLIYVKALGGGGGGESILKIFFYF